MSRSSVVWLQIKIYVKYWTSTWQRIYAFQCHTLPGFFVTFPLPAALCLKRLSVYSNSAQTFSPYWVNFTRDNLPERFVIMILKITEFRIGPHFDKFRWNTRIYHLSLGLHFYVSIRILFTKSCSLLKLTLLEYLRGLGISNLSLFRLLFQGVDGWKFSPLYIYSAIWLRWTFWERFCIIVFYY